MEDDHDHDRGLQFDLAKLLDRRHALKLIAGAAFVSLVGCAGDDKTTATTSSSTSAASSASCAVIPDETAGPYPGDGSNGPNVLTQSGIVRSDLTKSFGTLSGTAAGIPLTIALTVQGTSKGCGPLAGAAVYVWHCDRGGRYSLYSPGATDQNYLRGVQETDADGRVTFHSIFPAAYSGRWPHIHFEVYPSLAVATTAGTKLATSQLALPEAACRAVYATDGYGASVANLARTSLARDNVFSDGAEHQIATTDGSVGAGYTASLVVPV
jgi:protocatechuate 3,4-dioxygenase beta subunit